MRILFTRWRLADLVRPLVSFVHFVHVFARDELFYADAVVPLMKDPLVLYSTNTWLAYALAERFYGGVHYAWCSPVYNGSTAAPYVNIPPSSSPAEIYRQLFRGVDRGEQHSDAIKSNRAGVKNGADAKLKGRRHHRRGAR